MSQGQVESPVVVALQKLVGGYLYVTAEFAADDAERYTEPLPFLIDPASDRTLIVPAWHPEFEKCGIDLDDREETNRTLIGEVTYQVAHDLDVVFISANLEATCRVTISELAFVVPGQDFDGRISSPENTTSPVPVNVLGLDVLNHFTLLSEAGTSSQAFLIYNAPGILGALKKSKKLKGCFEPQDIPKITGVEFPDLPASAKREP